MTVHLLIARDDATFLRPVDPDFELAEHELLAATIVEEPLALGAARKEGIDDDANTA